MNSNESTLHSTIDVLNDYLDNDERSRWLADIQSVWDWDKGSWMARTPFLIRTEMRDITLIWDGGNSLDISTDPVDNWTPESVCDFLPIGTDGSDGRYEWRQHPGCKAFIGEAIKRFVPCPSDHGDSIWLKFGDGQSMRLSPAGIMAMMEVGSSA